MLSMKRGIAYGKHSNAKPILILSVMDGIEKGNIIGNKIMYAKQLENSYLGFCNQYEPNVRYTLFFKPFYHLSRESFYSLVWKDKKEPVKNCHTPSAKYLRENLDYAYLDPELWDLLQNPQVRSEFRELIINHYLKPNN